MKRWRTITGVPAHELSKAERVNLRRAWAIVDELAFIYREEDSGAEKEACCAELKRLVDEADEEEEE